jgi:hypothetical protein
MGVERRTSKAPPPIDFEKIDDLIVPKEDKTSLRIHKDRRKQLKVIAALSRPSKTVFTLTDAVLTNFIRRYEAVSGLKIMDTTEGRDLPVDLRTVDPAEIEDQQGSEEDRTTVAVEKKVREALKVISAYEGKTVFSISDAVIGDFVNQFEAAAGRTIIPRDRS